MIFSATIWQGIMTTVEYSDDKYVLVQLVNGEMMMGLSTFHKDKQCVVMRNLKRNEFLPIVIYREYGKIYKCPCCGSESGTQAPLHPTITDYFTHTRFPYCINMDKIPVEQ